MFADHLAEVVTDSDCGIGVVPRHVGGVRDKTSPAIGSVGASVVDRRDLAAGVGEDVSHATSCEGGSAIGVQCRRAGQIGARAGEISEGDMVGDEADRVVIDERGRADCGEVGN